MRKSKNNKNRKKPKTNRNQSAESRLNAIKYTQKHMVDYMLAGEMSHVDNVLLFYKDKPITKSLSVSQAFQFVRFEWTIMLGVLCRLPDGKLYIKQTTLSISKHNPLLARELNNVVQANLRKFWNECNEEHRLTGFFVCRPSDKDILNIIPSQLLYHYKTPTRILSKYELDCNKQVPDWFNDDGRTKVWEELFLDIDWQEVDFEPVNVTVKRQSHEEALADYKNYIKELNTYGKTLPRNFDIEKSSNKYSLTRAFSIG